MSPTPDKSQPERPERPGGPATASTTGLPGGASFADQDQQTYQRGTVAAILGLCIQVALFIATGLLGIWAESPAINAVTWHILGGLPIWIVLALIYNQHRNERRETLSAKQMATQDEESAALFGDQGDELLLSRRRLDRLYKWGLSVVSMVLAVYLIIVGIVLFFENRSLLDPNSEALPLRADVNTMFLMFAAGGLAFMSFISARWIAGYTRIKAWQLLRGGASYLMSSFVMVAGVLVGAIVATIFGEAVAFRWVAALLPVVMVVVGIEIMLTFLLSAYRPRRPGEVPRPAFDSRLLGVFTSPESLGKIVAETINYQFGFEISRSWFYRLLSRAITPLVAFAMLFLLAESCIVIVQPYERAVVMQFGKIVGEELKPGFHVKLPWPIQTTEAHPVGRVSQLRVGTTISDASRNAEAVLWTTVGDTEKMGSGMYFLTTMGQGAGGKRADGDGNAAGDRDVVTDTGFAMIAAEVTVQYRVAEGKLREYLESTHRPDAAIGFIAAREASRYFVSRDIDFLLTRGRIQAGEVLEAKIQSEVDDMGLGLEVVFVAVTGVHPPLGTVSRAFHDRINADQQSLTAIERAKKDALATKAKVAGSADHADNIHAAILELDSLKDKLRAVSNDASQKAELEKNIIKTEAEIERLLAEAKGQSAKLIFEAKAYRWQRSIDESASAQRFDGELAAFKASPEYYSHRRFYDVLSEGLSKRRKYIVIAGDGEMIYDMNFEDEVSGVDAMLNE